MHIRQSDFDAQKNQTRHFRLFELMRQTAAYVGGDSKPAACDDAAMEAFRDMACASLRY